MTEQILPKRSPLSFRLLLILLFLLPWQTRFIYGPATLAGGYWEYGTQSLYATQLLLGAALFVFLIERFRDSRFLAMLRSRAKTRSARQNLFIFACVLLYLGYVVGRSSLPGVVYEKLFEILLACSLALLILFYGQERQKLLTSFWLGGVVQGFLAIHQFLTQEVVANKWFGLAAHSGKQLGAFVVEFGDERWLRAYGSFGSPNILGGFLAVIFVCGLGLYLKQRPSFLKALTLVGELVVVAGLVVSFSRGAWLAAVFGTIAYALVLMRKKMWREHRAEFARVIVYSLLVVGLFMVAYRPLFATRLGGRERLEVQSNSTRWAEYAEWFTIVKRFPVFGVGPGLYTAQLSRDFPGVPTYYYQPIHNTFALIVAEWGLCGLVLVFWGLVKTRRFWLDTEVWPLLCVFFVSGFFDHFWISMYGGLMLGGAALSLSFFNFRER